MSEIVRGYQSKNGMLKTTRHFDDDKPVLILPIEDGKCGPFTKKMATFLKLVAETTPPYATSTKTMALKIATAISRLFEEVESED